MNLKTSNYGTARSVLGFLEILSWLGLGVGILLSIIIVGSATRGFGAAGLVSIIPAIVICIGSLIGIAIVQMAKAGVDTADYTYQGLAIARQQLEISKRALAQPTQPQSFADLPTPATAAPAAPEATADAASHRASGAALPAKRPAAGPPPEPGQSMWRYRDAQINRTRHGYLFEGETFRTLDLAKEAVDRERGLLIERDGAHFRVGAKMFEDRESAKDYVEAQAKLLVNAV